MKVWGGGVSKQEENVAEGRRRVVPARGKRIHTSVLIRVSTGRVRVKACVVLGALLPPPAPPSLGFVDELILPLCWVFKKMSVVT